MASLSNFWLDAIWHTDSSDGNSHSQFLRRLPHIFGCHHSQQFRENSESEDYERVGSINDEVVVPGYVVGLSIVGFILFFFVRLVEPL
jgi:hypothetical protein